MDKTTEISEGGLASNQTQNHGRESERSSKRSTTEIHCSFQTKTQRKRDGLAKGNCFATCHGVEVGRPL